MTGLVDSDRVLDGLKDFQRATVEHAYERLFEASDSSHRFLVADEVGLGKTMVARGVIAKAIERLDEDGIERIDVVYICSNSDIAAQNVRKLDVTESGATMASRLTLLASQVKDMSKQRLNVVALTPGTSFEHGSSTGRVEERVLLYALLRRAWRLSDSAGPKNLLQANVRDHTRFRQMLRSFDTKSIQPVIARSFAAALRQRGAEDAAKGRRPIRQRFDDLCAEFYRTRKRIPPAQAVRRNAMIAELRGLLAASCVEALEPDLVILDEFQRFKHLLEDNESEAASLARSLFTWARPATDQHARVLLLSATPYRLLTISGDGGDDDHHEDFLATVRFLFDDDARREELRGLLRAYHAELYSADPEGSSNLRETTTKIERLLSSVIARTERIGVAGQHDAMLAARVRSSPPSADDLRQYLLVQDVASLLEQPDVTELWKSAPFLLNFLDGYQLRKRFDSACKIDDRARELAGLVAPRRDLLLQRDRIESFDAIDPGGPRIRELSKDVIYTEAWRLLWVPPAMPYHKLGGPFAKPELDGFTKRLVFSAWRAVPRAAAGLLSYMAERELTREATPNARNTAQRRSSQRNRLAFTKGANDRLTGMPALALLYPSPTLAAVADPRKFASTTPNGTINALLEWAREKVRPLVDGLPEGESREPDGRWYWAAPLLLDRDVSQDWWTEGLAERWTGNDKRASAEGSHWREHVTLAAEAANGRLERPLGRKPVELEDVLARLALGAPGTLALRALARVTHPDYGDSELRIAAAKIAWALRGLFNSPEATSLLRAARGESETFWQEVVRYSIEGDLQAVLDEHAHVLLEAESLQFQEPSEAARGVSEAMTKSLGLRSSRVAYTSLEVDENSIEPSSERLHTAFAMRFGDEEGGLLTDDDQPARASQLREAFNSPYWPFVLVSTAVGQEGLDFHPYCHVVVHWNLPRNPVDLEQREGRVHRYKGHAVRKNVAKTHAAAALLSRDADPWRTAFDLAAADRLPEDSELVPYWIYPPGGTKVERHVLALPLSRELEQLGRLRDALAVYRLAFGQARQEDVVEHLLKRLGRERAQKLASELRIDLRPPGALAKTT